MLSTNLNVKETFDLLVMLMDKRGFVPANGGKGERGFMSKRPDYYTREIVFISFEDAVASFSGFICDPVEEVFIVDKFYSPYSKLGKLSGHAKIKVSKELVDLYFNKFPRISSLQYCRKTKQIKLHDHVEVKVHRQEYVKISDL